MFTADSLTPVTPRRSARSHAQRGVLRNVVWLRGDHDLSTAPALWQTMTRTAQLDDADLVIDLSGVTFMDASTVGVLMRTRELLEGSPWVLEMRSPSPCARHVLGVCGLLFALQQVRQTPRTVVGRRVT